jgi:hypothetical protein
MWKVSTYDERPSETHAADTKAPVKMMCPALYRFQNFGIANREPWRKFTLCVNSEEVRAKRFTDNHLATFLPTLLVNVILV